MKRQLFVIVILALAACDAASTISRFSAGRIVGGKASTIEDHPYQISLVYNGSHRCGGAIIHENFVLTAAHCVYNLPTTTALSYLQVRAGSSYRTSGGTLHAISYYTWHTSFTDATYDYDIGLIKVKVPFEFGSTIQPIELPPANDILPDGTILGVSGWGTTSYGGTSPTILQVVEVPLMNNTYCGKLYSYLNAITDRMVCAAYEQGGKDACQGDSGGPLFYGNMLVGLVSWGDKCASPYQPGVYASVSNLRNWVIEQTGVNFD